uniref:UDP-sugar diphosphatase n=1 Tax=Tetraselmis sp. GSL018 TaxID=582737 RepID=A0A061RSU4_9CHLO|eukprot:CAMPEP_0177616610 /NCGR_PEP_ID=MMETSP0419_2-20121207/24274_1 /TAXON_ID=582737 /ORGANISM="Tetraselmis sp., Strain GSL018" /LENGTH=133 /DNA_ID=CAMNT_0019114733 /DNA_START=791 /DNA_END=1192 /DNA_ORIENTATION=-
MLDENDRDIEQGFTYEICAGLIDKEKPVLQICKEEILEECGYCVPEPEIKPISSYISSAGKSGAVNHMFAAKVDESMRSGGGGGLAAEGEAIEVLALPRRSSEAFLADASLPKSAGAVAAISWALLSLERGSW